MNIQELKKEDFWRAIILYGLNQATYKIALGQSLIRFCQQGKTHVTMSELAEDFFDMYLKRLENGKPQLLQPNRRTEMEKIIDLYNLGKIGRSAAIRRVEKAAFNDVIPRFHTVYNQEVPIKYYEHTKDGLVLTDHLSSDTAAPTVPAVATPENESAKTEPVNTKTQEPPKNEPTITLDEFEQIKNAISKRKKEFAIAKKENSMDSDLFTKPSLYKSNIFASRSPLKE